MPSDNKSSNSPHKRPEPSSTTRKLAAVLFADIAGFTSLMQKDETLASTLLKRFQNELTEKVSNHNGSIVNFYGDGALCTFQNPLEAMRCAIEVKSNFQSFGKLRTGQPKVPVRMGIHSGTVVEEGDKVYGDSVNLASRIESMGIAGAILFSQQVRNELKNQPNSQMQSLGRFEFKNVEEPMEVFALANEGFAVPKADEMEGKLKVTKPKNKENQMVSSGTDSYRYSRLTSCCLCPL